MKYIDDFYNFNKFAGVIVDRESTRVSDCMHELLLGSKSNYKLSGGFSLPCIYCTRYNLASPLMVNVYCGSTSGIYERCEQQADYLLTATPTHTKIKAIIIIGETALGAKLSHNEVHCKFTLSNISKVKLF